MAQEDVQPYMEFEALMRKTIEQAKVIFPVLIGNQYLLDYVKIHGLIALRDTGHLSEKMNDKLVMLRKQMHCAHVTSEEENYGNDSHKEYFRKKCTQCGKVLEQWDV